MSDSSVSTGLTEEQIREIESKSYQELHKPSSSFATRDAYLKHELQIMKPKRWRVNLPFKDYRFEFGECHSCDGSHHW